LTTDDRSGGQVRNHRLLGAGLLFVCIAAVAVFLRWRLPNSIPAEAISEPLDRLRGSGVWGPAIIAAAYIPAAVFMVPGTILSLVAGFLFGWGPGVVATSIGSTSGAAAAFLLGRTLLRDSIQQRMSQAVWFRGLDRGVERLGFRVVLLTRLSPLLPFNLLNYSFGLTRIATWKFVVASWLGMLPGTIVYVGAGAAARELSDLSLHGAVSSPTRTALIVVGLIATSVVTVMVGRAAAAEIRRDMDTPVPPLTGQTGSTTGNA
jgi:uncharacterized membrane protein YdjX (TVP38/TMEM64 family)